MNSKITSQNPEKTILTFENILKRENYVICDTSLISVSDSGNDWYWNSIYPINRFSELALAPTEKQIESIKSFLGLLVNQKVLATKGVSRELLTKANLLAEKIKYLSSRKRFSQRRSGKRFTQDANEEGVEERMLNEVYDLFYESYIRSRRAEFSPTQKQAYGFLERIVLSVAEHTDAKRDYGEIYHPNRRPKNVEDFHTDEQLVATAFYLSLVEGRSGCILTKDSDIRRIFFNTLSYLSYSGRAEYKKILDSVIKKGIEIYHATGFNESFLGYSSFEFNPHFPHKNRKEIPPDKLRMIDSQIKPLNLFIRI